MTEGFKLTLTEIDGLILTEDNEGTQYDDE